MAYIVLHKKKLLENYRAVLSMLRGKIPLNVVTKFCLSNPDIIRVLSAGNEGRLVVSDSNMENFSRLEDFEGPPRHAPLPFRGVGCVGGVAAAWFAVRGGRFLLLGSWICRLDQQLPHPLPPLPSPTLSLPPRGGSPAGVVGRGGSEGEA